MDDDSNYRIAANIIAVIGVHASQGKISKGGRECLSKTISKGSAFYV